MAVRLIRFDINAYGRTQNRSGAKSEKFIPVPENREALIQDEALPPDSVIKLKADGKYIPWSLIPQFGNVEIQILRPHQHVKPKTQKIIGGDDLFRTRIKRLETRIASLEEDIDPGVMKQKLEKDLEILSKQIAFLNRRVREAEAADWVKNPEFDI